MDFVTAGTKIVDWFIAPFILAVAITNYTKFSEAKKAFQRTAADLFLGWRKRDFTDARYECWEMSLFRVVCDPLRSATSNMAAIGQLNAATKLRAIEGELYRNCSSKLRTFGDFEWSGGQIADREKAIEEMGFQLMSEGSRAWDLAERIRPEWLVIFGLNTLAAALRFRWRIFLIFSARIFLRRHRSLEHRRVFAEDFLRQSGERACRKCGHKEPTV